MPKNSKLLYLLLIVCLPVYTFAQYDPNQYDPNNAAHWYRKAFALYEEPNDIDLAGYAQGEIELTPKIERFLKQQQPVIDLIAKASQIKYCDWEYKNLDEFNSLKGMFRPDFIFESKKVAHLLAANIEFSLSEQNFNQAIGNCDLLLNMARDIGQCPSTKTYLVSIALRAYGYSMIHQSMNKAIDSPKHLGAIEQILTKEAACSYPTYNDMLTYKIRFFEKYCKKKYFRDDKIWGFTATALPFKDFDNDFFERNRNCYIQQIQQIKKLLELPYSECLVEIDKLYEDLSRKTNKYLERFDGLPDDHEFTEQDVKSLQEPDFLLAGIFCLSKPDTMISLEVKIKSELNALRTAIVLQQTFHKTNTLPKKIPQSCPKDLFSGKPFLIIRTDDGFKLKCQGEDLSRNEVYEYEFKLPKE